MHSLAASPFARWLFDHRIAPLGRVSTREQVEAQVQARTIELEREIARLREEIDRRAAQEREAERVRAESAAAAAERAAFLATFSHELRTPLNGIVSLIDLLRATRLSPEQADLVRTVAHSGEWLLRLVNDILDLSRIEAGRMTLDPRDFDFADALEGAIELHAEMAAQKGLELRVEVDPAVPASVRGDSFRLRQVIVNLLDNAVKFTDRGEVALRVRLDPTPSERGYRLRFDVTDSGIGVAPERQAALFQPFVQAEASVPQRFGGSGLGLAICRQLVTLMGGEIGVVSTLGAGATFWFTVDFDRADPVPHLAPPDSLQLGGRHILIVDDNPMNRGLFCRLADSWGMRAGSADSEGAALAYLREAARSAAPVEVVLIDDHMAGADGIGLAAAIRREESVPVPALAVLTSRGHRLTRGEMSAHGIAACEVKPLHPRKLCAMLSRVLRR